MVTSINIRGGAQKDLIFLWPNSGALPAEFTHECRLFSKHIKTIATACTNPNACVGSTHTELCTGPAHTHTVSGAASHTHHTASSSVTNTVPFKSACGADDKINNPHSHLHRVNSISGSLVSPTSSDAFGHSHGAETDGDPTHKTIRHVKYDPQSLRKQALPIDTTLFFADPVVCFPTEYIVNTCLDNNVFVKGVANACAAVLACGGSATHSHPTAGNHTHLVTGTSNHTHTYDDRLFNCTDPAWAPGSTCFPFTQVLGNHQHNINCRTISSTATGSGGSTPSSGTHTHAGATAEPAFKELAFITKNIINMRKKGVPNKGIVEWLEALACIPGSMPLADGTGCTENMINTWVKSTLDACDAPGSTGGGGTHAHTAATHTHTGSSLSHTHVLTFASIACGPAGDNRHTCATDRVGISTHTHSCSSPKTSVGASIPYTIPAGGSHSHGGCVVYDPPSLSIALLQRI